MKQTEFLWNTKSFFQDKVIMLDNGDIVINSTKNTLIIHNRIEMILRFVEFNENYIINDKTNLNLIINLIKNSSNPETQIYKFAKDNLIKKE